jgi:hypothetical protein
MVLTDSEVGSLKEALSCWEWFGYVSTAIVFVGCVGEFIAEFTSLPKTQEAGHKLARLSLIVLILGIAGELLSTVRTSQLSGQLIANIEERAAKAEQKAGEAEQQASANDKEAQQLKAENLRLEAIVSPRSLSPDQQRQIIESLRRFSGHPAVEISSYGLDAEALPLATQLISIIRSATGTMPLDRRANFIVTGGFEFGVQIRGPASEREFISALSTALASIGKLKDVYTNGPSIRAGGTIGGNGMIGGGGGGQIAASVPDSGPVRILIGVKPLSILTLSSK